MVKISHSYIIDFKILLNTLFNKKWLDNKGYIYFLFELKNKKELSYKESIFYLEEIIKKNNKIEELLKKEQLYEVYLTKFGVYGSYEMPNKIFLNIRRESMHDIEETFIHELIHLQVEDRVLAEKLSHEEKEKLVKKIFEDYYN